MRDCPKCGDPLSVHGECGSCGYGRKRVERTESREATGQREANQRAVDAVRFATARGSYDLSERQWYAVCKFWPNVAKRARRPMLKVGPDHPLDAQVSLGPLFGGRRIMDAEERAEREAIQREAA